MIRQLKRLHVSPVSLTKLLFMVRCRLLRFPAPLIWMRWGAEGLRDDECAASCLAACVLGMIGPRSDCGCISGLRPPMFNRVVYCSRTSLTKARRSQMLVFATKLVYHKEMNLSPHGTGRPGCSLRIVIASVGVSLNTALPQSKSEASLWRSYRLRQYANQDRGNDCGCCIRNASNSCGTSMAMTWQTLPSACLSVLSAWQA